MGEAGRTVVLSSLILSEVQAVADLVAILRHGRLVVVEAIDILAGRALRRIELTFDRPAPGAELATVEGVREVVAEGRVAHLVVAGSTAPLVAALAGHRVESIVAHEADLEDIFFTYYVSEDARSREA